ncbi:MAG: 2Fe-2S iron-sulfur cluster-binding protein [Castellaniella sp.]|uniref:2Fe-2S iron-sulfur cluster-binding protein n=1 Tax=Castellaniella sp. TaxID=1955812 RepID=UPI003C76ABD1
MSHRIVVSDTNEAFDVSSHETILDAALRAGIKLPHECTFGGCGTCRIKVQEGSAHYDEFPMALTEEEAAQGYALACQARPDGDMVITPASKGLELPDPVRTHAEVRAVEPLTADISRLVLQLPEDLDCEYRPGQHMNILLKGVGERSFSMASAYPFGNEVEFHIRRVPGGYFTQDLSGSLATGSLLDVEIPRGTFCYHPDDYRPMMFVATGTGLAPIRAILESLLDDEDCPPVSLYWGMRTEADLYAREELESWADRLYEFNFVPVLSQASDVWRGRRGHVQQAIAQDFDEVSEFSFYLCGSPGMVTDTKRLLLGLGAELDYIYSDSFTFHHREHPVEA